MKISPGHTFIVVLVQSLYSLFLTGCAAFYMLTGSMRNKYILTGDYVMQWAFLLLFFLVPVIYNVYKWRTFKKRGYTPRQCTSFRAATVFYIRYCDLLFSLEEKLQNK